MEDERTSLERGGDNKGEGRAKDESEVVTLGPWKMFPSTETWEVEKEMSVGVGNHDEFCFRQI